MLNSLSSIRQWPKGIRLYIALLSVLFTAEVYFGLRGIYGISGTTTIRAQQIYAWTSLSLILLALSIGPLCKLIPTLPGKNLLRDSRRMIGVSAAWFAAWHVGISYINQFHTANPFKLPASYQLAFLLGILALVILLALTATSFDAAFRRLGIWWFRLHRLLYVTVILIILHAFMIGSHALTLPFFVSIFVAVAALFAMHIYLGFGPGREPSMLKSITVVYGFVLVLGAFAFGYHQRTLVKSDVKSSQGAQYEIR